MRVSRPALLATSAASLSAACVLAMAGTAMATDVRRFPEPVSTAVPTGGPPVTATRPVPTTPAVAPG